MWERFAQPARRAVFFALWYTRIAECAKTDTVDLLKGLMYEEAFRANTIFGRRDRFPHRCNCPCKFVTSEEVPKYTPALTDPVKRILARTVSEADAMRDYWIDTEHLLLGIIAEQGCPAAIPCQSRIDAQECKTRGDGEQFVKTGLWTGAANVEHSIAVGTADVQVAQEAVHQRVIRCDELSFQVSPRQSGHIPQENQ